MKKSVFKWLLGGNLLIILVLSSLLVFENNRSFAGLAALESVGRFVIYAIILAALVVSTFIIIYFLKRKLPK